DRLGALPAGADPRQAVFHVLRARRASRPAPRGPGMDCEVQREVRSGLGQATRGDARATDSTRCRARRDEADAATEGDPRLGLAVGGPEATLREADGDLRRL